MAGAPGSYTIAGLDILRTDRETNGALTAQLGDVVSEEQSSGVAEWWQHVGFASRPKNPDAGKAAAQAVVLSRSNGDAVIGSRDARGFTLYGSLDEGETVVYASKGQAKVLLKNTGEIVMFSTVDNQAGGQSVMLSVGPEGFKVTTPWGQIVLNEDGLQFNVQDGAVGKANLSMAKSNGNVTVVSGGTFSALTATVMLGAGATGVMKGLYFSANPPGFLPSRSVFISL